jgi:chromosome segregation ATPase
MLNSNSREALLAMVQYQRKRIEALTGQLEHLKTEHGTALELIETITERAEDLSGQLKFLHREYEMALEREFGLNEELAMLKEASND